MNCNLNDCIFNKNQTCVCDFYVHKLANNTSCPAYFIPLENNEEINNTNDQVIENDTLNNIKDNTEDKDVQNEEEIRFKQYKVIRDINHGLEIDAKVDDILTVGEFKSKHALMKNGKAVRYYDDDIDYCKYTIDTDLIKEGKILKQRIAELERKYSVINRLHDERIFSIKYIGEENACYISEACDGWFGDELSKQDCLDLSAYFKELAEALNN